MHNTDVHEKASAIYVAKAFYLGPVKGLLSWTGSGFISEGSPEIFAFGRVGCS